MSFLDSSFELYHEIFGSVLDRIDLNPYLMRNSKGYADSLSRASLMMENRGFFLIKGELGVGEIERASQYVSQALHFMSDWLFPMVKNQLKSLLTMDYNDIEAIERQKNYQKANQEIDIIEQVFNKTPFTECIQEDPRHLFILVSLHKYPNLFDGYKKHKVISHRWSYAACAVLKMCHLIKSIEEDSQDIYDFACLGLFFESHGISLSGLYNYPWQNPLIIPEEENARRAFVKMAFFFKKLNDSVTTNEQGSLIFNSGDGIEVELIDIKARLKSPESMFAKLGKDVSGEVFNIRDILAITFLIKNKDDSLKLFHSLQKQGVILQENTVSTSITQTLYETPEEMYGAVAALMCSLAKREGNCEIFLNQEDTKVQAKAFLEALSVNEVKNPHSSHLHRKFQCKINYSVPVQHYVSSYRVIIPGSPDYKRIGSHGEKFYFTRQHTLPVELRISDIQSWQQSELSGEAHHEAYKCRQLIVLLNRLFSPMFSFSKEAFAGLRIDQNRWFE